MARVRSARRQDGAGRGAGAVGTAGYGTHTPLHVCTEPWPARELLTRGGAGAPASARRRPPGCASRGRWPRTPRPWRRRARTRARGICGTATATPADPGRATKTYVGLQHTSMHAQAAGQGLARRGRAAPGWVIGAARPWPRWHARTAAHVSAPLLAPAPERARRQARRAARLSLRAGSGAQCTAQALLHRAARRPPTRAALGVTCAVQTPRSSSMATSSACPPAGASHSSNVTWARGPPSSPGARGAAAGPQDMRMGT